METSREAQSRHRLRKPIECVVSIALSNKVHCKFNYQFYRISFIYFFYCFWQWPLIFNIAQFNTAVLYRFLLKFLKLLDSVQYCYS